MSSERRFTLSEEQGYTLIELLVASVIGLMVIGAAVYMFTASSHSEPRTRDRVARIADSRLLMANITRELRQGSTVVTATPSQLAMVTYVRRTACGNSTVSSAAILCRVTYTCSAGVCTRTEKNSNGTGTGTAVQVASGLSNSTAVFSYLPSAAAPTYVGVELIYPAEGTDDAISLKDGVALRN